MSCYYTPTTHLWLHFLSVSILCNQWWHFDSDVTGSRLGLAWMSTVWPWHWTSLALALALKNVKLALASPLTRRHQNTSLIYSNSSNHFFADYSKHSHKLYTINLHMSCHTSLVLDYVCSYHEFCATKVFLQTTLQFIHLTWQCLAQQQTILHSA